MLMPDGSLTLLDFGCARSMEDGRSMTVVLKPGFAPIEQYQTRGQGPYTDIYALCATLYYCITGQVPPAAPDRLFMAMTDGADKLVPPAPWGWRWTPGWSGCCSGGRSCSPPPAPAPWRSWRIGSRPGWRN